MRCGCEAMPEKPPSDDVTAVLAALDRGEADAPARLLPLVYDELRRLAAARMSREPAGLTLQPTALVHEAYVRLVDGAGATLPQFQSRAHFFGAAAEAMRRILIDRARHRGRIRHGGGRRRERLSEDASPANGREVSPEDEVDLIALDDALSRLSALDARLREIVMLRFFAGLTVEQTAAATGLSPRTVKRDWEFARSWLHREMERAATADGGG